MFAISGDMSEQESPGGSVGGTPHRKPVNRKKKLPETVRELATKELTQGYCVLLELLKGHTTFRNPPDSNAKNMIDYYEVVKEPMWLYEMLRRFDSGNYKELSQFAADMRLLLENCYRFFDANSLATKRALKLEHAYVRCVALLPGEMRSQCSLLPGDEVNKTTVGENEEYKSKILELIVEEKKREEEEHKRKVAEQMSLAEENKDIIHWEREVLVTEDKERQIKGMWELPLIGQFVYLALDALNIDEMSMYEVERMLLMPQASKALARLVTSLLISPPLRQRLVRLPPMSYHEWSRRLILRVASWYRTHFKNDCNPLKTFEMIGVETEFWKILGETNPLEEFEFHELTFHQRVWVLKTLCDVCLQSQPTVCDTIGTSEVRDSYKHILGNDRHDFRYEHLPELCGDDLRVYRQAANSMSLIERDEVYWEHVATKTGCEGDATKDCRASDACTSDSNDAKRWKIRAKSTESDSGLSCNSSDTRQCDDSSNEQTRAGSSTILARHDYVKTRRHLFNPHWLSPEDSGFEVVADSYEALNELITTLNGDVSDQRLCIVKTPKKKIPKCEGELLHELQVLASNLKCFEIEFIVCMKKAREKMYKEWQEFQKRPVDFVDPSDAVWNLSGEQHEMSADQHEMAHEKGDKLENSVEEIVSAVTENHNKEMLEHKSEEGEGRERYSRRAKRKVDMAHIQRVMSDDALLMQDTLSNDLQLELLDSDMEDYEEGVEEDDDDDVWEMPSKKKKVSKPKTLGRKRKSSLPDAALPDGSTVTPKTKKCSSVKKIANTSNSKVVPVRKSASRKLFCNENSAVTITPAHIPLASSGVGNAGVCERLQDKSISEVLQKPLFSEVSVKKEVNSVPCMEPGGRVASWEGGVGCVQVKQDTELKQEIKEEPQATVKQECAPVADSTVASITTQNVEFQPSSVPMLVYQPQQINALTGASSVIIAPIIASVPFSPPNVPNNVPVTLASQMQTSVSIPQLQTAVPVSQVAMSVPSSLAHVPSPVAEAPVRRTVLQRAGGPTPAVSSDVICLDTDSSDSDVEFVEIKTELKPAAPKSPTPKSTAPQNPVASVTPGRISVVPKHMLQNEVTPPKNLIAHPLSTLKKVLDKRLNVTVSGDTSQEVGQRLPIFTVQQPYQTVPNTPPTQALSGTTNIHVRNVTPARPVSIPNLLQSSPNTQKHPAFGRGTDVLSSFVSTPRKQSPVAYSTTPRNIMPAAYSNSPRGGSPATFSPNTMQWHSPRGQLSPRPATRGRGVYTVRQATPLRGQTVAVRGRASPMQQATTSPGPRARLCQQDNLTALSGTLQIVGDVDPTTGTFRYALVTPNGSKIVLTPEQVDQIRKGNGGMLPSSL